MAVLVLAASCPEPASAQGNVYLATSFFRQKKFDKVLRILETIDDPGPRLLLFKGESLAGLDRRPEAVAAFHALVEKFPDHPDAFEARRRITQLLETDRNFTALIEAVRKFRGTDPAGRLPYNRLEADAMFKAGRYDEAIALLEASDDTADQRTLAEMLRDLNRIDDWVSAKALPASGFRGHRRRGLLLGHLRVPDQARIHFEAALVEKPEDRECLENVANLSEQMGDIARARETWEALARLHPSEIKYASQLGRLEWAAGDREAARKVWKGILEGRWDDVQRARLVVRLLTEHEDPATALEVIERVRRVSGRDDHLLDEEETAHLQNRDPRAAIAVWVRNLLRPIEPGTGETEPRARILELSGASAAADAAWAALEEALTRFPRHVEYSLVGTELAYRQGRPERAAALVDRLLSAVGKDAVTLRDDAVRFRDEGRHAEAARLFLAALAELPAGNRLPVALEAAQEQRATGAAAAALKTLDDTLGVAQAVPEEFRFKAADLRGRILLEDLYRAAEARRHFTAWIPRLPADSAWVAAWVLLAARSAQATGDFPAAEAAFKALRDRGGLTRLEQAELDYREGKLRLYAGRLEEARKLLREVSEKHPDSPYGNDALREVAWLLDHREAGEEELKKVLALRHLVEAGRFEDYARAAATVVPEGIPEVLAGEYLWLETRWLAQAGAGKRDELLARLRAGADHPGGRATDFLWELAEALEVAGRPKDAEATWKEFLLENPESLRLEDVRTRLARLGSR